MVSLKLAWAPRGLIADKTKRKASAAVLQLMCAKSVTTAFISLLSTLTPECINHLKGFIEMII